MAIFPLYISTVELQHYATRAERRVRTPPLKKAIPQPLGPLFPLKPHSERKLPKTFEIFIQTSDSI